MYIYIYIYINIYVFLDLLIDVFTYVHTYLCVCRSTYIYICMYSTLWWVLVVLTSSVYGPQPIYLRIPD